MPENQEEEYAEIEVPESYRRERGPSREFSEADVEKLEQYEVAPDVEPAGIAKEEPEISREEPDVQISPAQPEYASEDRVSWVRRREQEVRDRIEQESSGGGEYENPIDQIPPRPASSPHLTQDERKVRKAQDDYDEGNIGIKELSEQIKQLQKRRAVRRQTRKREGVNIQIGAESFTGKTGGKASRRSQEEVREAKVKAETAEFDLFKKKKQYEKGDMSPEDIRLARAEAERSEIFTKEKRLAFEKSKPRSFKEKLLGTKYTPSLPTKVLDAASAGVKGGAETFAALEKDVGQKVLRKSVV